MMLPMQRSWCLKVVDGHFSYNSCSDFANLSQCLFADSEIAHQFSLGKTKCRYMILYGIAPYCNSELLKQINSSPYFSLLFDKSLNPMLEECQVNVNIQTYNFGTMKPNHGDPILSFSVFGETHCR